MIFGHSLLNQQQKCCYYRAFFDNLPLPEDDKEESKDSIKNTISPEVRIKILDTVNSMLDEIRLMKDKFSESEEKAVRQSILGHLNGIWTTLEDTRPEKMSGYGRMCDLDKELLSPHILKLLLMCEDTFKLLR